MLCVCVCVSMAQQDPENCNNNRLQTSKAQMKNRQNQIADNARVKSRRKLYMYNDIYAIRNVYSCVL